MRVLLSIRVRRVSEAMRQCRITLPACTVLPCSFWNFRHYERLELLVRVLFLGVTFFDFVAVFLFARVFFFVDEDFFDEELLFFADRPLLLALAFFGVAPDDFFFFVALFFLPLDFTGVFVLRKLRACSWASCSTMDLTKYPTINTMKAFHKSPAIAPGLFKPPLGASVSPVLIDNFSRLAFAISEKIISAAPGLNTRITAFTVF